MRKFNVELNKTKLQLKKQQLSQIETQLADLITKVKSIEERKQAKLTEVFDLETAISTALNSTVVSE